MKSNGILFACEGEEFESTHVSFKEDNEQIGSEPDLIVGEEGI